MRVASVLFLVANASRGHGQKTQPHRHKHRRPRRRASKSSSSGEGQQIPEVDPRRGNRVERNRREAFSAPQTDSHQARMS